MGRHLVKNEKLIEELNRLIIPLEELTINIPDDWDTSMREYVLNEILLDWCSLGSKEAYDRFVIQKSDSNLKVKGWEKINQMIIQIYKEIALSATSDQDFTQKEKCLRDIMLELLKVGWPHHCTVYKAMGKYPCVRGPFIYPNNKMDKYSSMASINLAIGKNNKWVFFKELNVEYEGYIWNQEIWLDDNIINSLEIEPGDEVDLRLFMEVLILRVQYLMEEDGTVYELDRPGELPTIKF